MAGPGQTEKDVCMALTDVACEAMLQPRPVAPISRSETLACMSSFRRRGDQGPQPVASKPELSPHPWAVPSLTFPLCSQPGLTVHVPQGGGSSGGPRILVVSTSFLTPILQMGRLRPQRVSGYLWPPSAPSKAAGLKAKHRVPWHSDPNPGFEA